MVKYTKIRCPNNKRHNKRKDNLLIIEDQCNALLPFVAPKDGNKIAIKCKDCKTWMEIEYRGGLVYITPKDKNIKFETDEGRVVICDS